MGEPQRLQGRSSLHRAEVVEHSMEIAVPSRVLRAELIPARPIVQRIAGEGRREVRIGQFQRVGRYRPDPRDSGRGDSRVRNDVVDDDEVRPHLPDDRPQLRMRVLSGSDVLHQPGMDDGAQLVEGRAADVLDVVPQPLPQHLAAIDQLAGWRYSVKHRLFESVCNRDTSETGVHREHRALAPGADYLRHRPQGVVGPPGSAPLNEEDTWPIGSRLFPGGQHAWYPRIRVRCTGTGLSPQSTMGTAQANHPATEPRRVQRSVCIFGHTKWT